MFNSEIFPRVLVLLELTIDNDLGLLHLFLELLDEHLIDTVFVLAFRHDANLEFGVPIESVKDVVDLEILVKLLIFRVFNLFKIQAAWLLIDEVLIGRSSVRRNILTRLRLIGYCREKDEHIVKLMIE